jgi:hypothetical protein
MMQQQLIPTIPGMSLTSEPGNRPWEQPPLHTSLDDVVAFYVDKLTSEKAVDSLLDAMEANISLMSIANGFIRVGVIKGIHTVDMGFIAIPIIIELMKTIGDMNDVGYVVEDEDFEKATEIDEDTAKSVLQEAVATVKEAPAVKQGGLMSKE